MSQSLLAVPPHAIAQVVQVASDPECSSAKLAGIIKNDPILSAQVLKAVNSAFYSLSRPVSSVDHAISYMGIRSTRNLVLCMGVRQMEPPGIDFPLDDFWGDSLRRGAAAQSLARTLDLQNAEDCFTLGLCQDLGILVLLANDPGMAGPLGAALRKPIEHRLGIERASGTLHDETGAELFEKWRFPEDLSIPIRYHHRPEDAPEPHARNARIACAADHLAALLVVDDKASALDAVEGAIQTFGMDKEHLDRLLAQVEEIVQEAGEMLNIRVDRQMTYQEIAELANQGLIALNVSYEQMTGELEASLKENREVNEKLQSEKEALEKKALTDELTGLPNRRSFKESCEREISRASRTKEPLSLLILDIDHFKSINDTYGHQAGDAVLKSLGELIGEQARKCDLPARYGGEEFVVLLPSTKIEGALIAAERYRLAVEKMVVECGGETIRVTTSIGVSELDDPDRARADVMLLRSADDALYEAKEAGRNRVVAAEG